MKGIDLTFEAGAFVVLVGESGCGKSTLLRALAGLIPVDAGDIHIDDRRVNDLPPAQRGVSMVFQSYALFPHMTVAQNLAFPLMVRKRPKPERQARAAEVAATLGLQTLLDRYPAELSGGQRQRVAIGRALVREPDIYLFDEPLSNLDAALRGRMRVELKELHRRLGRTMVYVTHDQVEAMTLADRIAVLDGGQVQQYGTPEEIYRRPANRFVATFFGTPTMNLLEGEVRDSRFAAPGVTLPVDAPDGPLVVGIRPEDVCLDEGPLRGTVELIEPVGDRGHLHVALEATRLAATVSGAAAFSMQPGEQVRCQLPPKALHLFSADTGTRLP